MDSDLLEALQNLGVRHAAARGRIEGVLARPGSHQLLLSALATCDGSEVSMLAILHGRGKEVAPVGARGGEVALVDTPGEEECDTPGEEECDTLAPDDGDYAEDADFAPDQATGGTEDEDDPIDDLELVDEEAEEAERFAAEVVERMAAEAERLAAGAVDGGDDDDDGEDADDDDDGEGEDAVAPPGTSASHARKRTSGDAEMDDGDDDGSGDDDDDDTASTASTASTARHHKKRRVYDAPIYYDLPREPFSRLVREIAQDYHADLRFAAESIDALQFAAETYLAEVLVAAGRISERCGRKTIFVDDLKLGRDIANAEPMITVLEKGRCHFTR